MIWSRIINQQLIRPTALGVIAIGFLLRLYGVGSESLWYDELLQLDISQGSLASIWPQLPKHTALPLDYLITHFWIDLGRSEAWVRLPAVILGTLTLPLAYQLGRKLLDNGTALLFMTLLAFSPLHVRYSQEVRPYALLLLGVMLAGYAFWQLRRSGRWRHIVLLQIGVLIFSLAHFFAITIFIPWLIFGALDTVFSQTRRNAVVKSFVALWGTGFVALLVILSLGWGRTLWNVTWWGFGQSLVETERFTLTAQEKPNFGTGPQLSETFIRNEILGPLGAGDNSTMLRVFNGLAILGLAYLIVQKRYRLSGLLLLWFILPVMVIITFLIQRGAFYEPRYIIFVMPTYLMLVAAGILALPRWLKCAEPKGIAIGAFLLPLVIVLAGVSTALGQYYAAQEKEDWRLVGQLLAQNAGIDDAVIAVNAESTLNWYFPLAAANTDQFDTLEAVQAKVSEAERSWIVMSVFTGYISDGKRINLWLSEQGAVRLVLDPLIAVYYMGSTASPPQLLEEARSFALPIDHVLYAELARQNRREPTIARQYFQVALENAPNEETRASYQAEIDALPQ